MGSQEEWTDVKGARLRSLRAGDAGPPVVLVPGFVLGLGYMRPLLEEVGKFSRAWALDLPGHGRSDPPERRYGVKDHASALAEWLEGRVGGPAVLVPNSLGVQVAVQLAVARPGLVRGLVLLGPATDQRASVLGQVYRLVRDMTRERRSLFGWQVIDLFRVASPTAWREAVTALRQPEESLLRRVSAPTLVVRGGRDPIVPQEWAERVVELLPRGRLAVLPGRPHAVNHNAPVPTAHLVREFVEELERAAGKDEALDEEASKMRYGTLRLGRPRAIPGQHASPEGQPRPRRSPLARTDCEGVFGLAPLSEQVVVIMGASSGIGRETAIRAAHRGARVVLSSRSVAALERVRHEISSAGGHAIVVPADVTQPAEVNAVASAAADHFGGIDTWVHTAAVMLYARFEDTAPAEFARVVEVNLLGQVHGALAALPHLRRRGRGALVHVSSIEARRTLPYNSAYGASKHGINGFLQALRVELEHEKVPISVTTVMPSSINTPLYARARTKIGVKPIPYPPLYQPGTVAEVILHAAEHPSRHLLAGGAGAALLVGEALLPRAVDALLRYTAFRLQRTSVAKDAETVDSLDRPVDGGASRGEYRALQRSFYNWIETRSRLLTWRR